MLNLLTKPSPQTQVKILLAAGAVNQVWWLLTSFSIYKDFLKAQAESELQNAIIRSFIEHTKDPKIFDQVRADINIEWALSDFDF